MKYNNMRDPQIPIYLSTLTNSTTLPTILHKRIESCPNPPISTHLKYGPKTSYLMASNRFLENGPHHMIAVGP